MAPAKVSYLNGYRLLYMPDHPKAMKGGHPGYVYEHVYVAEKYLERSLTSDEVVHHLNLNRSDNRWRNLLVISSDQHSRLHCWIDRGAPGVLIEEELDPVYCEQCKQTIQKSYYGSKGLNLCKDCMLEKSFAEHNIKRRKGHKPKITDDKPQSRKVVRPSKEELKNCLDSMSFVAIGRKYGVSDNSIRKWAQRYKLI